MFADASLLYREATSTPTISRSEILPKCLRSYIDFRSFSLNHLTTSASLTVSRPLCLNSGRDPATSRCTSVKRQTTSQENTHASCCVASAVRSRAINLGSLRSQKVRLLFHSLLMAIHSNEYMQISESAFCPYFLTSLESLRLSRL